MRLSMLTDEQLKIIVESESFMKHPTLENICDGNPYAPISDFIWNQMRVMAMEILEFRRAYGSLGCEWLEC